MELYLMRHGIAVEQFEWSGSDATRSLTPEGEVRTRLVVRNLKNQKGLALDEIWSSPYLRAMQTAEIVRDVLGMTAKVRSCPALACGANVSDLSDFFESESLQGRHMFVGHEPDMGRITFELATGEYQPFKKAAVAYLKGEDLGAGKMEHVWYLRPKDLSID